MNYIEKMLQDYCPNGVEWKELGEVCNVVTDFTAAGSFASNAKNVKYLKEPNFAQLIRTTDLKSKFQGNKFIYVDEHAFNYLHRVNLNEDSLILPNVGNCGEIYYLQPSDLPSDNNVLGPNALLIRSNMADNRYLYHLFLDSKFQSDLEKITSKTGQTKFNKTNLKKILIPIPPLEIQEEIVKILDKFTEYVTELTDRQKQYSFYRDKLLSFEDEVYRVEWKTLGEVCGVYDGTHQTPKYTNVGIPFVSVENIKNLYETEKYISKEDYSKYKIKPQKDDVFMTRIGDIGTCTVVDRDDKLAYYVSLALLRPDKAILNSVYLKFFIESTHGRRELNRLILHNATPIKINKGDIGKIKIAIPPLPIQESIVQVLDNFDAVCNDLSIGLPKEIELRQKQYEYFREKLLTFTAEGVYHWTVSGDRPT